MPWARFDDRYPSNRKVRPLSDAAFRLDVSAICWSSEHLTDGRVPLDDITAVSDVRRPTVYASELVGRGRWHKPGHSCEDCAHIESGWVIHDYLKYNPPRSKVLAEREAKAKRQQRWLDAKRHAADASRDASLTPSVTHPPPPPPKGGGRADPSGSAARPLSVITTCPTHLLIQPCISCAADTKAGTA